MGVHIAIIPSAPIPNNGLLLLYSFLLRRLKRNVNPPTVRFGIGAKLEHIYPHDTLSNFCNGVGVAASLRTSLPLSRVGIGRTMTSGATVDNRLRLERFGQLDNHG